MCILFVRTHRFKCLFSVFHLRGLAPFPPHNLFWWALSHAIKETFNIVSTSLNVGSSLKVRAIYAVNDFTMSNNTFFIMNDIIFFMYPYFVFSYRSPKKFVFFLVLIYIRAKLSSTDIILIIVYVGVSCRIISKLFAFVLVGKKTIWPKNKI